jgi:hypothetical protein
VIWQFYVKLTSKNVLPVKEFGYDATVENWRTNGLLNPRLSDLCRNAPKSLSIRTADAAADELGELGDPGLVLLNKVEPSDISFIQYWHDPSAEAQHLFGATFGLPWPDLDAVRNDLDNALFNGCMLSVSASGGFSSVDPNRYSTQPTQEKFEAGFPLRLSNTKITVEVQQNQNLSNEHV